MTEHERQERMEKLFEKMLNMEMTNREMYEQCRNVAHEPMTNEEWLRTCSAEELAEWLYQLSVMDRVDYPWYWIPIRGSKCVVEWLKQPHKGE